MKFENRVQRYHHLFTKTDKQIVAYIQNNDFDDTFSTINSPIKALLQLTGISNNNLLSVNQAIHHMTHHYEIIMVYPTFSGEFYLFEVERIPELIKTGEQATIEELPNIKSAIENFGT